MKTNKRHRAISIIAFVVVVMASLFVLARNALQSYLHVSLPSNLICTPYPESVCTPSPDVTRIAFSSDRACFGWLSSLLGGLPLGSPYDVYVMNTDGSCATRLTHTQRDAVRPRWSPDGTRILFETGVSVGNSNVLYVMNADGSRVRRLADCGKCAPRVSWSPDGSLVAFLSGDNDENCTLYVIGANGAQKKALVDIPLSDTWSGFDWSPNGTQIAFSAADPETRQREVYTINVGGSELTNLTNHQAQDDFVAWTPGGHRVLFVSDRDVKIPEGWPPRWKRTLYIMDANGANVQRLMDGVIHGGYNLDLDVWIPFSDSQIIVELDDGWHVVDIKCVITDSTEPGTLPEKCHTRIPDPYGLAMFFGISDEGQFVYSVVADLDTGIRDIFVVNFDGTGLTNLTNCPADDIDPDWSP